MWAVDKICKALFFYYMFKLFFSITGLDEVISNFMDHLKSNESAAAVN
jgi:hypothetical protein